MENRHRSCVYIAGPYSGKDAHGQQGFVVIEQNILNARRIMAELVRLGYFIFCPHTHSAHFEVITPEIGIDYWYSLDMYFLRFCHALLRLNGASSGADNEVAWCLDNGIPVFYTLEELQKNLPVFRRGQLPEEREDFFTKLRTGKLL